MADINYTITDHDRVRTELINLLRNTDSFKDANYAGTNMAAFVNLMGYNAELWGYYVNQIANEPFLDTAKLYKNLNRLANTMGYNPVGWGQSQVEVITEVSNDYTLTSREGFIQIPAYSVFPSGKSSTVNGSIFFTNEKPILIQVRQFGTHPANYSDFEYNGKIGTDGVLNPNKLQLPLNETRMAYILGDTATHTPGTVGGTQGILNTVVTTMFCGLSNDITEFKIDTEYTLVLQYLNNEWSFEIAPVLSTVPANEVAKFKIESDGSITFVRNTSTGLLSIGRLGYQNLEYAKFNAISTQNRKDILSKLQFILPQGSPVFQVMYNGEIVSFDSIAEDITVETDIIPSNFFTKNQDMFVVLNLTDRRQKYYGAKLELKIAKDIGKLDVVIASLPVNNDTFEEVSEGKGNLLLQRNLFIQQEETKKLVVKTGTVQFSSDEYQKRVTFEEPFEFYLPSKSIPADSDYDYAIMLTPEGNVTTFWSEKTTEGFILNVEPNTGFEGNIIWKVISYKRNIVQEKEINISKINYLINAEEGFSVLLQPQLNISVWLSDVAGSGFNIVSDSAFMGDIDYLIIPKTYIGTANEFEQSGSVIVARGQLSYEVKFDKSRAAADYRVFLQPNSNVRVWPTKKTTDGFVIMIEPATDFSGKIDWQIHEGILSGTATLKGGDITGDYSVDKFVMDLNEKQQLGMMKQGAVVVSLVEPGGAINSNLNKLSLSYYTEPTLSNGLRYTCLEPTVSYTGMRVFVKIDGLWVEFTESTKYQLDIDATSKVFYARVNKDKLIDIWFGNNDREGISPLNYKIAVIGFICAGPNGNIGENALFNYVEGTTTFDTTGTVTGVLETSLLKELKMVQPDGTFVPRLILDHNEDVVPQDVLSIIQVGAAFLGTEAENEEGIRKSAKISHLSQDRLVSTLDYRNKVFNQFSDIIVDVSVYNYIQASAEGLISDIEIAKYYYNTVFLLLIPAYGNSFTIGQKKMIQDYVENDYRKQSTINVVILEPTFVSIDIMVAYKEMKDVSPVYVQNGIVNGITSFFERKKHKLGELVTKYDLQKNISNEGLQYLEIKMNKDVNNSLFSSDYNVDIPYAAYQDKFEDVEKKKLKELMNKELKNLLDKGIITINQPLFDYEQKDGAKVYPYTDDIQMNKFEFPVLGDIVIERRI